MVLTSNSAIRSCCSSVGALTYGGDAQGRIERVIANEWCDAQRAAIAPREPNNARSVARFPGAQPRQPATHDIGFDRDQRNGKVTHKIDGAIDDERDYVGKTLEETGLVAKLAYIVPSHPSKEARTATGGTFHSDGRVLVIALMPAASVSASDHPAR